MLFILHYNMIFFFKFSFITVVLIEECSLVKNEFFFFYIYIFNLIPEWKCTILVYQYSLHTTHKY